MSQNMAQGGTETGPIAPGPGGSSPLEGIMGRMHPQHAKVLRAIVEAPEEVRGEWRIRRFEMPQSWVITAFRDGLFRAALAKLFNAPFGYRFIGGSGKTGIYEVYAKVVSA